MKHDGRLQLVPGCGDDGYLADDAGEAGFAVLLEIWQSAMAELAREVSPEQLRILLIVDSAGGLSLGRLAGALGVSGSAVGTICDRMEAAGLLRRRGRGSEITVALTVPGRRLMVRIREERRAVLDHVIQSLSPAGREALTRALSEFAASSGS